MQCNVLVTPITVSGLTLSRVAVVRELIGEVSLIERERILWGPGGEIY